MKAAKAQTRPTECDVSAKEPPLILRTGRRAPPRRPVLFIWPNLKPNTRCIKGLRGSTIQPQARTNPYAKEMTAISISPIVTGDDDQLERRSAQDGGRRASRYQPCPVYILLDEETGAALRLSLPAGSGDLSPTHALISDISWFP